jgi:hypothetical protein
MKIKFSELHTVIWAKAIAANVMKSWQMWAAYIYIAIGGLYDYLPAFRLALGRHYNTVFMITGVLMILLRLKSKKPIVISKDEAVEKKYQKDFDKATQQEK